MLSCWQPHAGIPRASPAHVGKAAPVPHPVPAGAGSTLCATGRGDRGEGVSAEKWEWRRWIGQSIPCHENQSLLVAWLYLSNQVVWRCLSLWKDICHLYLGALALKREYQQKCGQLGERCFPGYFLPLG